MKKKIFTLLTLLVAVCTGAWADDPEVTVTWFPSTMTSSTFTVAGTASVDGLMTVNNATHSTPVSDPVYRSKTTSWAKYTSTNVNVNGSNKNRWLATDYIVFSVEIADGVTFTPTEVTATVAGSGTSGCNAGLFATKQSSAQSGQSSGIKQEQDGGKNYTLTSFSETSYTGGETLTFYIHIGIPSGKAISVQNVVLTGTYVKQDKSKYTKPSIVQGEYSQPDGTYAVTLSVQNDEDGTINYTVGDAAEVTGAASGTVLNLAPGTTVTAYVTGSSYGNSDVSTLTTSAAPTLATPTYAIGSYNLLKNLYGVSLNAAAGDITYTIGGTPATYSEALLLAPGTDVEAFATQTNMTQSATLQFSVPAAPKGGSTTSTTTSGTYTSNTDYVLGGITIPGACIAGQISSSSSPINGSIKTRCNQGLSDSKVGFYVNVNPGYTVTEISIVGCSNATGDNTCTAVYVDGVAVDGFSSVSLPLAAKDGNTGKISVTGINATNKIEFAFDNTYQAQMNITVTYGISASATLSGVEGFEKAFATFCAPQNFIVTGATAYKAKVSDDKLVMTALEGVIPAGTAVIIAGEDAAEYTLTYVSDEPTADVTENELLGVNVRTLTSTLAGGSTLLALNSSEAVFQSYTGTYFPANKAYLLVPNSSRMAIVFADGQDVTAIKSVADNAQSGKTRKYIRDGKLVLENAKGVYSIQGTQIK